MHRAVLTDGKGQVGPRQPQRVLLLGHHTDVRPGRVAPQKADAAGRVDEIAGAVDQLAGPPVKAHRGFFGVANQHHGGVGGVQQLVQVVHHEAHIVGAVHIQLFAHVALHRVKYDEVRLAIENFVHLKQPRVGQGQLAGIGPHDHDPVQPGVHGFQAGAQHDAFVVFGSEIVDVAGLAAGHQVAVGHVTGQPECQRGFALARVPGQDGDHAAGQIGFREILGLAGLHAGDGLQRAALQCHPAGLAAHRVAVEHPLDVQLAVSQHAPVLHLRRGRAAPAGRDFQALQAFHAEVGVLALGAISIPQRRQQRFHLLPLQKRRKIPLGNHCRDSLVFFHVISPFTAVLLSTTNSSIIQRVKEEIKPYLQLYIVVWRLLR